MKLFAYNLWLKWWTFRNVPLLFSVRPKITFMQDDKAEILIPFNRRNKNHLGSMYMGVLVCGADLAGGILATHHIRKSKEKLSLVFKDIQGQFHKRPEGDTVFVCEDGLLMQDLVKRCIETKERHHAPVTVLAKCRGKFGEEAVATFTLTISLKKQSTKV